MEEAAVELATPTTPSNIKTFHLTEMKVKEEEEVAKISNQDNATPPTRHKTTNNNSDSAILHSLP